MREDLQLMQESRTPLSMNPRKFALWLFIGTVVMLFGAFTSAFIVATSERAVQDVALPDVLLYSTIVIVLSSATMHYAYFSARKDELSRMKVMLGVTLVLGAVFLVLQYYSWKSLVDSNIYFSSNYVAGSFIYVLTGFHGLHIVSALVFLLVVIRSATKLKIHSKSTDQIEMCTTYWHFLGALWLYLYIFLLLNFN